MQLIETNSGDLKVISETGRIYEIADTNGLKSNSCYDIAVIFDFDVKVGDDNTTRIVDFFYGSSDFIDHPENALAYIKKAITKYEIDYGYRPKDTEYTVIKEF